MVSLYLIMSWQSIFPCHTMCCGPDIPCVMLYLSARIAEPLAIGND